MSSGLSRRGFVGGALLAAVGTRVAAQPSAVKLPPIKARTERQDEPPEQPLPPGERVGVAVVGLGDLAIKEIIPALALSKKARLAGLVSGSPAKAREIARATGVPAKSVYDYKSYDRLRDDPDVQAVYVVLPDTPCEEGLRDQRVMEAIYRAAESGRKVTLG